MRVLMGTGVVIEAWPAGTPADAAPALEQAFAAVARVAVLMHPTRPGSDLARINALESGESVRVDPDTWEVLELARRLHAASGGVFDPCLPHAPGCLNDLGLVVPDRVSCRARVALDLGGIAKGYAVDRAIAALSAAGCRRALVNAGGDLRVLGSEIVWLSAHARQAGTWAERGGLAPLALRDAALAVSELKSAGRPSEHRGYYRRGAPLAAACTYAAVTAPRAAVADALTKCVLLGAADPELLETFDARVLAARSEQMPEDPVQRA
jgi:FAD:protein FMN transferase